MCFTKTSPYVVILTALLLAILVCSQRNASSPPASRNHSINFRGEEYTYLAGEGQLRYLGELVFEGSESDDPEDSGYYWLSFQPGIYSVKGDEDRSILIRYVPYNEWYFVYRKSSLPPLDFSLDNCSRLELAPNIYDDAAEAVHVTCGKGITDQAQIAEFLSDVRLQKSPEEAGLYELIPPQNGIQYVHNSQVIYAFFEEESNAVLRMEVSSYNDQVYSIRMEGKHYILPEEWLDLLRGH